jgi:hypothetical protein
MRSFAGVPEQVLETGRVKFVLELFVAAGRLKVLAAASSPSDSFGGYYVVDS